MILLPKRRSPGEVGKIQMTPMIDVVFQLLIFFLVASDVRPIEADFQANMPLPGKPPVVNKPKETPDQIFRVFLRRIDDGRSVEVTINGEALGQGRDAFRVLGERLGRLARPDKVLLIIDGDGDVRTQFVTDAIDCAVSAHIQTIGFGRGKT